MDSTAPPHKRLKLNDSTSIQPDPAKLRSQRSAFLSSLSRPISPPLQSVGPSNHNGSSQEILEPTDSAIGGFRHPRTNIQSLPSLAPPIKHGAVQDSERMTATRGRPGSLSSDLILTKGPASRIVTSPFRLTRSHDLPSSANIDTVNIKELLGSPLIKEAWIFNYCHDVHWTMQQFDPDIRNLVSIKIIHGFWRTDSGGKIAIDEACSRYPNVQAIQAWLPDTYGTHHTKMLILIRHDDLAQIIIHTANMIPRDWENTTQAAWCSPLLPLDKGGLNIQPDSGKIGSGARFKHDLIAYLRGYARGKMSPLINVLQKHDFSAIRGALIGSIPSKKAISDLSSSVWGHIALKRALKTVPIADKRGIGKIPENVSPAPFSKPVVVCQVSSIATFKKEWLEETLFKALAPTIGARFSIIFPTPDEVRCSLDGYASGGSIHLKAQTAVHQKQIDFLRPHLCHWASPPGTVVAMDALRGRAAPHIKTYIRFCASDSANPVPNIEWALLTSANLSMQAWGTAPKLPSKKEREEERLQEAFVHIQSYELGVLVWPELFAEEGGGNVCMVPVFGTDSPVGHDGGSNTDKLDGRTLGSDQLGESEKDGVVVGLRMPYDLPLLPYSVGEEPWSPHSRYDEPDTHGHTWPFIF
jgi:tyrosyl-DNA phosphodiesterase 1